MQNSGLATTEQILTALSLLGGFMVIILFGKLAFYVFARYKVTEELLEKDNPAVSVVLAGYYMAISIIYAGALMGPSKSITEDLLLTGGYSALGIVLLHLSALINHTFILRGFSVHRELTEDRNPGAGVVVAGSYISAGLLIAGAIHGVGGGIETMLAFYAAGQAALVIFALIYDLFTPYSLREEIEKDNIAAGIGFSGGLIAIGIILMKAVSGSFTGWVEDFQLFGFDLIIIFVYLILTRLFFDYVLIGGGTLNTEIAEDRNLGAGMLEFSISVGFSTVLFFLI